MKEKQLGQFRKSQLTTYMTPITFKIKNVITSGPNSDAVNFEDKKLVVQLQKEQSYYFNFSIRCMSDSEQIIKVYLTDPENPNRGRQNIQTYTVREGENEIVTFEQIICPIYDYTCIVFELQRTVEDYQMMRGDRIYGRSINIQVNHLHKLTNILDILNLTHLYNIGIQGPSGLLMSINGEEIRIGRSGIYEMVYPITINSIGFVILDDVENITGQDYFVMDYQY